MRKALVATLALSPLLLHAQARLPAQTDPSPNAPVLQSSLVDSASASPSANPDIATIGGAKTLRISTGVVRPKLIHTVDIVQATDWLSRIAGTDRTVTVDMTVDETGKPTDLKIVQSADPSMNENVLEAVRHYRFKPGTVSGQPTPVPVTLELTVRTPLG